MKLGLKLTLVVAIHIIVMFFFKGLGNPFPILTLVLLCAGWIIVIKIQKKWLIVSMVPISILFCIALDQSIKLP